MNVIITGSAKGLGLGFAEHYLSHGHQVFAIARDATAPSLATLREKYPTRLFPISADVTDPTSLARAAKEVSAQTQEVDLLINNAGRYGKQSSIDDSMDWDDLMLTFRTNAMAPVAVSQAFLPLMERGAGKKIVHITSLMGSIQDNTSARVYGYRMSKAALNMANKNLAIELRDRGILSAALHPGWVRTDMGGKNAPLDIATSVTEMAGVIDGLTLSQTGQFFNYDGKPLPF